MSDTITIDLILGTLEALNDFSAPVMLRVETPLEAHGATMPVRFDHLGMDMPLTETEIERVGS